MRTRTELIGAYNQVAKEYAGRFYDEMEGKPFDRALLKRFASELPTGMPVVDIGCGPGHVGAPSRLEWVHSESKSHRK